MYTGEEVLLVDREHMSRADRSGRRRAGRVLEQSHLAKEIVGTQCSQSQLVSIAVNEDFDAAFLNNEHACARIPLPKDYVAVAVLFPQIGHADALTCIFSLSILCRIGPSGSIRTCT